MPQTKTALKALRKSRKKRIRNSKVKSELKKIIKKFKKLLEKKEVEEAKGLLPFIYKKLDMASSKGIIHKNTASRKKSRLSNLLKKFIASGTV